MKKLLSFALIATVLQLSSFADAAATVTLNTLSKVADQYLSFNFGNVPVNSTSSVTYTVRNSGDQPLKIEHIQYSGAGFSANSRCPDILEPGKSCNTRVTFWPPFEGLMTGRVIWYTSDNNIILDLWGTGSRTP